ncbi:metal-dependent cyclase [Halobacteriales archaeon QS_5_70_17]|nr:MAG: metal-dependent cyclase [Halobacteriales archaeon QS_5_70_17]
MTGDDSGHGDGDGEGAEHERCDCGAGVARRDFVRGCGAAMAFAAVGSSLGAAAEEADGDVAALLEDLPDNWGRWGEDDERGALNLLGSEEAYRGLTAALRGGDGGIEQFTLQLSMTGEVINPDPDDPDTIFPPEDADEDDPQWPSTDTGDPAFPPRTPARRDNTTPEGGSQLAGGVAFVDDKFVTEAFLQGTTHLDALGHAWYGEQIYNGFDVETTEATKEFETPLLGTKGIDAVPDEGEESCLSEVSETAGLEKADAGVAGSEGIAARAVLLDVGRHAEASDEKGRLPLGYEVTLEDLRATAEAQGVEVEQRDVLLIRTGSIARSRDPEAEWAPLDEPGLVFSEDLVEWIAERDVPYVGADNLAVEKAVQTVDGDTYVIPLHGALLRDLGVYLNEILWLEDLGAACARDGIYDFLFVGAPLNVERASGSPINPLVLKETDHPKEDGRTGADGGGDDVESDGDEEGDEDGSGDDGKH